MSLISQEDRERFERTGSVIEEERLSDSDALNMYDALAHQFIAKVEAGEARSLATYAEFKRLLARKRQ